jgi:hypothetical protein
MTSKSLTRWSPMACLPVASLTPSGLLEMDIKDGEVELMRRGDMELRSNMADPMVPISESGGAAYTGSLSWIDRDEGLKVSLTTHRLVFFQESNNPKERNVRFLHLANVHTAETEGGGMFSSPKINIGSYMGDVLLIFRSSGAAKDRDDLHKFLKKAMERRAWEVQTRLQEQKKKTQAIAARKVGVVSSILVCFLIRYNICSPAFHH